MKPFLPRPESGGAPVVRTVNLPPVFSELIAERYCTLRDLQEYYSYQDALDLFEVLTVNRVNDIAAREHARKKAPRRH